MPEAGPVDTNKLRFDLYSTTDNFSTLSFRVKDGSDPLGVDAYIHNNPQTYIDNHVSSIFCIRYEGKIVAYFTLSMSSIGEKEMQIDDTLDVPFKTYPALLLGQMGVETEYQRRGISRSIIRFCRGIGQELNGRAACAFLILFTSVELAKRYYGPKFKFKWKPKSEGKVWMYRKLF